MLQQIIYIDVSKIFFLDKNFYFHEVTSLINQLKNV